MLPPSPLLSRAFLPRFGLAASLVWVMIVLGACRKSRTQSHEAGAVAPGTLFNPHELALALIARGGAQISATTRFHIVPTAAEGLQGEQDITTTTTVTLGGDGHYSLHEENDHDGGRDVFFTGNEIAVKLRYGKLIKRAARAPEPMQLLEQALGGPGAAWDVFHAHAQVQAGEGEAKDTMSLALSSAKNEDEPLAASSPLIDWRKTAVPSELSGKLRYLPGGASAPPALVAAEIKGKFNARTVVAGKTNEVLGLVEVTFAAREVGRATPQPMPADAETAWMRQRTILEERALLGSGAPAKGGLPP